MALVARVPHGAATAGERGSEIVREHWRFKMLLIHLISLMHAVALARLRSDYKLTNLEV